MASAYGVFGSGCRSVITCTPGYGTAARPVAAALDSHRRVINAACVSHAGGAGVISVRGITSVICIVTRLSDASRVLVAKARSHGPSPRRRRFVSCDASTAMGGYGATSRPLVTIIHVGTAVAVSHCISKHFERLSRSNSARANRAEVAGRSKEENMAPACAISVEAGEVPEVRTA